MARLANDGRGRLGGRAKGTKNKPPQPFGEWAEAQLSKTRRFIEGAMDAPFLSANAPIVSALIVAASIDRLTNQLAAMNAVETDEPEEPENPNEAVL